jgi:hypothetical protein
MIKFLETVGELEPEALPEPPPHPIKGRPHARAVIPKVLDLIKLRLGANAESSANFELSIFISFNTLER